MKLIIGFVNEENKDEMLLAVIDEVVTVIVLQDKLEYVRKEVDDKLMSYSTAKFPVWFRCLDDNWTIDKEAEEKLIDEMIQKEILERKIKNKLEKEL